MSEALERFLAQRQLERASREIKFPLRSLLILHSKVHYKIPFNDFLLLVRWLGPYQIPEDTGAKYFLALNSFEGQQLAQELKISPRIVQQIFMEIYYDEYKCGRRQSRN